MSKKSRDKGSSGERELFGLLSDELGIIVNRGLSASRDGGCDSLDVPGWATSAPKFQKLSANERQLILQNG